MPNGVIQLRIELAGGLQSRILVPQCQCDLNTVLAYMRNRIKIEHLDSASEFKCRFLHMKRAYRYIDRTATNVTV